MPTAIEEQPAAHVTLENLIAGGRPRVLRGLCADWPMVRWARESDTAFAQGIAAFDNGSPVVAMVLPGEAQTIGYNAAMDGFNYEQFRVSVTQVLQRLAAYSLSDNVRGVALQSALIAECLPRLLETHALPLLEASIKPRLWMGNRVTTPAHFDSDHNIAVVACGRRRFTLFAPEQVSNLYVGPLDYAPTVAAISIPPLQAVDDPRYPRLASALASAQTAVLEPGDAIYIPPVWWHHVESLEQLNALVNYWFRPDLAPGYVGAPGLPALMHCILAYKSLPAQERAAWKALLDHYVFDAADPATHIPVERRGVLGGLSPEVVSNLKQRMRLES
jgi:hypothetical protein